VGDEAAPPITYDYALRCSAEHAFATYAERIGTWWDPRYSANADTLESVTIEPRVGGRVFATHGDVGRDDWGEVQVWEPGRRLVYTSTLAQSTDHPSLISVDFEPDGPGCVVLFAHGGWTEDNVAARAKFGDWPILLDRFAALAQTGS
jgi:uncharacterized protein YndB with AHSA1/START domain